MRRRLLAAVLVALALVAAVKLITARRREARAREAVAQSRAIALGSQLVTCLVGDATLPRDASALNARLRRIALSPTTPADWPARCAADARALDASVRALTTPTARLTTLAAKARALAATLSRSEVGAAPGRLRAGDGDAHLADWAADLRALDGALGERPAVRSARALTVLPAVNGDVIPVSVAPGSVVAGHNLAAGTFTVLFIEPSRERVLCRSRDRGASMRCRRFPEAGAPHYLVGNDAPESLLFVDGPRVTPAAEAPAVFVSADSPTQPVFSLGLPLVWSLPMRVSGDALYALANEGGSPTFMRCARGGACVKTPFSTPMQRESVLVSTGADAPPWWLGVGGETGTLSLDARTLPRDAGGALGEVAHVVPLRSAAALLGSCHAQGVAYVAVVDAPGTHLVAVESGRPPRTLGALSQCDLPFEIVCDSRGATLVGSSSVQSCAREGGCSPRLSVPGYRRFARVAGELVMVSPTRDGGDGLRVRSGDPARVTDAPPSAVDDDAAHGGLSARAFWVFAAEGRLILFATGATTAVLWSDDKGARWQPTSEATEVTPRPPRMGSRPR